MAESKGELATPAAGGDAIVSTRTKLEDQARRYQYCWIIRNRDRNDLTVRSPL